MTKREFVEAIISLSKASGWALSHEDTHGAFKVVPRKTKVYNQWWGNPPVKAPKTGLEVDDFYDAWLRDAVSHIDEGTDIPED